MMTRYLFAGQMAVVEFLLNRPDRNEVNPEGITALHQAARFGQTAVLELLLSRPEVDVNAKDNEGKTALRWALNSSQVSAVELLLGRPGAGDLNEVDNEGNTALHRGIRYSSKLAEFLVRRPEVDVNKVNNEGKHRCTLRLKLGSLNLLRFCSVGQMLKSMRVSMRMIMVMKVIMMEKQPCTIQLGSTNYTAFEANVSSFWPTILAST